MIDLVLELAARARQQNKGRSTVMLKSLSTKAAGRFTVPDARIALSAVAGGLLALLRPPERHSAHAGQALVDPLAEGMLRMLGIPAAQAARLAALPLPETGAPR
jgi:hypothetical protein